jgi:hypothetical protein
MYSKRVTFSRTDVAILQATYMVWRSASQRRPQKTHGKISYCEAYIHGRLTAKCSKQEDLNSSSTITGFAWNVKACLVNAVESESRAQLLL